MGAPEEASSILTPLSFLLEDKPFNTSSIKLQDISSNVIDKDLFVIDKIGGVSKPGHRKTLLRIQELCIPQSSTPPLISIKRPSKSNNTKILKMKKVTEKQSSNIELKDLWDDSSSIAKYGSKKNSNKDIPEAIHSGSSYNPSKEAHKKALALAVVREVSRKSFRKILRQNNPNPIGKNSILVNQRISEVLPENVSDSILEEPANEIEHFQNSHVLKSKSRIASSKKSAKKRRHACQLQVSKKLELKKLNTQIENIRQIASNLFSKNKVKKPKKKEKRNSKYQPPMFPVVLNSELPSSLRKIESFPTEPFMDRFKNFQQKNLLEVRLPSTKKRRHYALKKYEKRSYKDFDLSYSK